MPLFVRESPISRTMALILLLVLGGCSTLQNIQDSMQKPSLSVESMRVGEYNFQQMELIYDIRIENPNPVGINLLSYDYQLDIADNLLIQGDEPENSEIEASGESVFQLPVTVTFSEAYQSLVGVIDSDEAPYNFSGSMSFDLPVMGETELSFEKKGEIPLLELPRLTVDSLQVENISLNKADLNLKLQFNNPNGFGLNINHLNYDLIINGDEWAQGKALKDVTIHSNGTTELSIPLSLNIAQMGMSVYRMLTNAENLDYRLKGSFNMNGLHELLGETAFDFDRTGEVSLSGN